jgi:hypothetical protein
MKPYPNLRCPSAALVAVGLACLAASEMTATELPVVTPADYHHATVYHSPQTPGFTSWVGTWAMPNGDIMLTFTQATGPIEGRPLAPPEIQRQLDWPPKELSKNYDMTGLEMTNVHLRSKDGGQSWEKVSADAFKSNMNGITGEPEVALPDGTILRAVWGHYLPYNPEVPKTGYIQRSHDNTASWGKPEVLLDPAKFMTYPKRLRLLRDGRLIAVGGVAYIPVASIVHREQADVLVEPLLLVSADQGKTWEGPIKVVPPENRRNWGGEEYDVAELANGDLLCVFRRPDPDKTGPRREVRWQGVLKKQGLTWVPTTVGPAPFPHSGHPELLTTREGVTLHFATTGVHWTNDAGKSWHKLDVPGTAYYPHSVQTRDGRILVFGHIGRDDAYGSVDQSIVMDSFRLKVN